MNQRNLISPADISSCQLICLDGLYYITGSAFAGLAPYVRNVTRNSESVCLSVWTTSSRSLLLCPPAPPLHPSGRRFNTTERGHTHPTENILGALSCLRNHLFLTPNACTQSSELAGQTGAISTCEHPAHQLRTFRALQSDHKGTCANPSQLAMRALSRSRDRP